MARFEIYENPDNRDEYLIRLRDDANNLLAVVVPSATTKAGARTLVDRVRLAIPGATVREVAS